MAALTTQNIVAAGTAPTFGAAAASDTAEVGNGQNTFAVYKNASASNSKTVTIVIPGTLVSGDAFPDKAYTLGTTSEIWIPLRKEYAEDAVAGVGRCTINITGTGGATDVTVAVVRMG